MQIYKFDNHSFCDLHCISFKMLSLIVSNIISIIIFYITAYYVLWSPLIFIVVTAALELAQVGLTRYLNIIHVVSFSDKLNAVIIHCMTYIIYFIILKEKMNSVLYAMLLLIFLVEFQVCLGRYIGLYKF